MAILATIKKGVGSVAKKVADKGGNVVAKASGLTSAQLEKVEEKRREYLSEKPEHDSEGISRLLGSYAIEAYEAYLPKLSEIYAPMSIGTADDTESLIHRIRYFEITKWVSDPTEDNIDKLTNMYHVLSEENCNIALIYDRRIDGCKVYMAVVNNDAADIPSIANAFKDRLESSLRGNFPGVEIKADCGAGVLPTLKKIDKSSIAVVSNIASEKSEKFVSQSMEKLLDGIIPRYDTEEYVIVLLATPVKERLERKNALSELYSKLAPYASWQTNFTLTETTAVGSSATFGANLGGSAGRQVGDTAATGDQNSQAISNQEGSAHTDNQQDNQTQTNNEVSTKTSGEITTHQEGSGTQQNQSTANMNSESDNITAGVGATQSVTAFASASVSGGVPGLASGTVTAGGSATLGLSEHVDTGHTSTTGTTTTKGTGTSTNVSDSRAKSVQEALSKGKAIAKGTAKGTADTIQKSRTITDTIGRMASNAHSIATNIGMNFGVNFSRSSNVTVLMGKNDGLTQNFVNYDVKNTLEMIEKQIKRIENSTALGMWDFSAYFLSESSTVANNAAHMYLSLTQGNESYLSQSAVNLWEYRDERKPEIANMLEFIKRLQHPEFEFIADPTDPDFDEDWLMYPPHVNATVSITGRELAYSLNMPKKSVSGLPVLESVSFGREVQKFSETDNRSDNFLRIGNVYHMRRTEPNSRVKLDLDSLCSHAFITGSTGTGKSNFIYNMLQQIYDEDKHFLVIEPAKGEYKNVLGGYEDVSVYGTNPLFTEMLHINPFSFPAHINVLEHIDRLVEIFNACWVMYAAMPAVLKDAIERAYKEKGWILSNPYYYSDDFPTFIDLMRILPEVMNESMYSADTKSDYSGALITRVKSLTNGINGEVFCSATEISNEELFDRNVIVDISRVGSVETKSLIMGILIMKLQEYRMQPDKMNEKLQHVTVLEEAHHLLRKISFGQAQENANLQGKSVEMLTNAIAEMRTYGEGFIIADQAPDMLDEAVIRNTNTKIAFRLPDENDCQLVGKSIALTDIQIKELAKLPAYVAVVYQNNWIEALLCKSNKFDGERRYAFNKPAPNQAVNRFLSSLYGVTDGIELTIEENEIVRNWIDRLENGDMTKNNLRRQLAGETLSENDIQMISYNVFSGNKIALLLRNAETTEAGIVRSKKLIKNILSTDDTALIDTIHKYICLAINNEQSCIDISRRYNYFDLPRRLF